MRPEAARIAFALIQFEEAGPQEHYVFLPSLRRIPRHEVEAFLAALTSPALLCPTTTRGTITLTLLHELSGDRRAGAEKILGNATVIFDELSQRFRLTSSSRILLDVNGEKHVLSHSGVRLWTQQFGVQVGWNMDSLGSDAGAQARLNIRRSDGVWSSGRL